MKWVGADICRCMSQGKGSQASKARQRGSSRERKGASAVTRVRDGFLSAAANGRIVSSSCTRTIPQNMA